MSEKIAEAVGLSQSHCWRRIRRLHEEGYILKVLALLDRERVALHCQVFVQVKVKRHDLVSIEEFSRAIREFPEVMDCYVVYGAFDFALRVVTEDMIAYEKFFFEKLAGVQNVLDASAFIVTSGIKSTTALPIIADGSSTASLTEIGPEDRIHSERRDESSAQPGPGRLADKIQRGLA